MPMTVELSREAKDHLILTLMQQVNRKYNLQGDVCFESTDNSPDSHIYECGLRIDVPLSTHRNNMTLVLDVKTSYIAGAFDVVTVTSHGKKYDDAALSIGKALAEHWESVVVKVWSPKKVTKREHSPPTIKVDDNARVTGVIEDMTQEIIEKGRQDENREM